MSYVQLTISRFDSGNGLVSNRRQAITWINGNWVHWRMYISPSLNRFKSYFFIGWLKYLIFQNFVVHFVRARYICNQYDLNSYSNCDNTKSIYNAALHCIVMVVDFTTRVLNPDHFSGLGAGVIGPAPLIQFAKYSSNKSVSYNPEFHTYQHRARLLFEEVLHWNSKIKWSL